MTRANIRTREDAEDYLEFLCSEEADLDQEYAELENVRAVIGTDCPRAGLYNTAVEELAEALEHNSEEQTWVIDALKKGQFPPVEDSPLDPGIANILGVISETLKTSEYKVKDIVPPVPDPKPSTDVIPDYLK